MDHVDATRARFDLLAGDRPYITACFACGMTALRIEQLARSWRVRCEHCGPNGFIRRADLLFAPIGLGQTLRDVTTPTLAALLLAYRRGGEQQCREDAWGDAIQAGRAQRVLRAGCVCLACGSRASIRQDVRGEPYLSCRLGCKTRLFLPRVDALHALLAWGAQCDRQPTLWNGWFVSGRSTWESWHAASPATATEVESFANIAHQPAKQRG